MAAHRVLLPRPRWFLRGSRAFVLDTYWLSGVGGVGGSEVGAVGAVEAQLAVGVAFDAVAVVEHAVVAGAAAEAVVDVGVASGLPGVMWWMSQCWK